MLSGLYPLLQAAKIPSMKVRGAAVPTPFLLVISGLLFFTCLDPAVAAPPKVVKAVPDDGASDVDPALKELRVEFDQPMLHGMSVVGGGPAFPNLTGKPRWENDHTFVCSWRLEPDHDYWLSINSDRFTNFRGTNGEAAVPHPISFHTAELVAVKPTDSVLAANREAVARLKRAIDEDYSYRELRCTNWDQRFKDFSPRLESAVNARKFAAAAARLLEPAKDVHLWLEVDKDVIPTFQRQAPWNINTSYLPRRIPKWKEHNSIVATGEFDDGIRYIFIGGWPAGAEDELTPAFQTVADAAEAGKSIIIDVRANGGGSEILAREFAGCFVDQPIVFAKNLNREHGEWLGPFDRELEPNKAHRDFKGRVAVLAGQGTVSSSESFVMMMKQCPNCTLVGDHTAGCSGNPKPTDLGNGVRVFLPSWKDLRLDGTCIEGEGFAPDVPIKTTDASFEKDDPVVAAALHLLRK